MPAFAHLFALFHELCMWHQYSLQCKWTPQLRYGGVLALFPFVLLMSLLMRDVLPYFTSPRAEMRRVQDETNLL